MANNRLSVAWIVLGLIAASPLSAHAQQPAKKSTTVEYDIRDLVRKKGPAVAFGLPGEWTSIADARLLEPGRKAVLLAQAIDTNLDPRGPALESLEIVNDAKLVIRAAPARHAEIASLLQAFRRLADIAVIVKADLFEVDDAFHARLKNAKPIDWEEEERRFLDAAKGKPQPGDLLLGQLAKQKPVVDGKEVKADNGEMVALLSRFQLASYLPTPEQLYRGRTRQQTIPIGVALTANTGVSSDRRFVRIRLAEHATEVVGVTKRKVLVKNDGEEQAAEIPLLNETTTRRDVVIADGGTVLVPVQYRPASLQKNGRRWVLRIHALIRIEEEEEAIRKGLLEPRK